MKDLETYYAERLAQEREESDDLDKEAPKRLRWPQEKIQLLSKYPALVSRQDAFRVCGVYDHLNAIAEHFSGKPEKAAEGTARVLKRWDELAHQPKGSYSRDKLIRYMKDRLAHARKLQQPGEYYKYLYKMTPEEVAAEDTERYRRICEEEA